MKQLTIYRLLTYIFLPFAALFGLLVLFSLLIALGNVSALLSVFLLACIVIYIITSFLFLQKGIQNAKPCKSSLKDWIKVNAYVSLVFSLLCIMQSITALANPVLLQQNLTDGMALQKTKFPPGVTPELILKMMKGFLYFMIFFSSMLLVHIAIGFRLLKLYHHVFDKE